VRSTGAVALTRRVFCSARSSCTAFPHAGPQSASSTVTGLMT